MASAPHLDNPLTFDESSFALGADVVSALLLGPLWCHRRIESLNLLEGQRARRKVSIDCTPTDIKWAFQGPTSEDKIEQVLVPLAFMAKRPLRDLDVLDPQGNPVSVLGTEANGRVASAAIGFIVEAFGGKKIKGADDEMWSLAQTIAFGLPSQANEAAVKLLEIVPIKDVPRNMILDLANNFLLMAVLPKECVGKRQILKYSYHWQPDFGRASVTPQRRRIARLWHSMKCGFGLANYQFEVDVNALHWARSFHFECPAPSGSMIERMSLPVDSSLIRPVDENRTSIGHAHGHYGEESQGIGQPVEVELSVDRSGLLPNVLVGAIGVVVLLAVLLCAPPLYSALQHSLDSATAILLAVPALFLGLLAGRKENQMLLELFRPLRLSAAILAAILLLLALLLVIGAGVELSRVFLIPCLIIAVAIFSLSFGGYFDLTVSAKR